MTPSRERMEELVADRVLWGLSETEARELARFGDEAEAEFAALERTGAAITAAILEPTLDGPPAHLQERLRRAAEDFLGKSLPVPEGTPTQRSTDRSTDRSTERSTEGTPIGLAAVHRPAPRPVAPASPGSSPWISWSGWAAAAAAAVVALVLYLDQDRRAEEPPLDQQLQALLREDPDLMRLDWEVGPQGEIVWSPKAQRGFLRLRGLAANAERQFQYQLWIFDRKRSAETPVDGGVFDIDTAGANATPEGDLLVPIDAKILVHEAFAFAITKEEPGGVVVSAKRPEQIVAAAGL
jgi:anti-sigma-K factor RskA